MFIGYARVSTNEQDATAQASALKAAGCERIFREKATGGRWNRPELQRLLDDLRKGDVLVVWKLDRLSPSLRDVLTIMERIQEAKPRRLSVVGLADSTLTCSPPYSKVCRGSENRAGEGPFPSPGEPAKEK
jgi:DNA invertase Pin-like site-specific DNA recombinase